MIYFCWVGEPQLQIYQGVFILSIAKAFFPLAEPVVVLRKQKKRPEGRFFHCDFLFELRNVAVFLARFALFAPQIYDYEDGADKIYGKKKDKRNENLRRV